ncbi:hypothetical protein [Ancylobacter lacus]|nr:hypothetical protein [Ancylobacter lacus]MBS7539395.1 hypothetical protein [Ancylobacter lacus]
MPLSLGIDLGLATHQSPAGASVDGYGGLLLAGSFLTLGTQRLTLETA